MKSALVTGANRGLGLGIVSHLSRYGALQHIFATCRQESEELKQLAAQNENIHILKLDLLDTDQFDEFASKVSEIVKDEGLNVLLNNAGVSTKYTKLNLVKTNQLLDNFLANTVAPIMLAKVNLLDTDQFDEFASKVSEIVKDEGLNVLLNNAGVSTKYTKLNLVKTNQLLDNFLANTVAPIMLAKSLTPLLKQAAIKNSDKPIGVERAAIVNMSSILGSIALNDQGGFYPYRCSKAALNAATKSMSIDLKKDNILVTSVHPGWVKTDMGGKNAPMDVHTSISGLFVTLKKLSESDTGKFYQYDGAELLW